MHGVYTYTIAYLVSYAPMHAYYSVHVMSLRGPILGIQLY